MRKLLFTLAATAFFFALLAIFGFSNFGYMEQMRTFYWHWPIVRAELLVPGGLCTVIAGFLKQFFVYPWFGAFVTALLLGVASLAFCNTINRIAQTDALSIFGLLPATAMVMLLYNTNFMSGALVAYVFFGLALAWTMRFINLKPTYLLAVVLLLTLLLYLVAGAVAMVYAIAVVLAMLFRKPRVALLLIAAPAFAWLLGYITLRMGVVGEMKHAILPEAYFTHRLKAPSAVVLPWGIALLIVVMGGCLSFYHQAIAKKAKIVGYCLSAAIIVAYAILGIKPSISKINEGFKQLNLQVRAGDWEGAIANAQEHAYGNLLYQNVLNLALAETGQLGERLFDSQCIDIRTIYQQGDKTPYVSMLMSDIYYSMGHMAQARRYAFEANEMLGNLSPRLLQRLALVNMAYGADAVATKYLKLLSKTIYYKDWAQQCQRLINAGIDSELTEADADLLPLQAEVLSKRACIFPDDRFSAIRGLDDDLKQIINANPRHRATREYLGALYLLSKDVPRFHEAMDSFYRGEELPRAFQEAMLIADPDNIDSIQRVWGIPAEIRERLYQFNEKPSTQKNTFWYFYRYAR